MLHYLKRYKGTANKVPTTFESQDQSASNYDTDSTFNSSSSTHSTEEDCVTPEVVEATAGSAWNGQLPQLVVKMQEVMNESPPRMVAPPVRKVDVCIVGGGIAGLVAGILCHRQGLTFCIVAKEERHGQGMGFLLQDNALSILRDLGIDFKVKRAGCELSAMQLQEVDGEKYLSEDEAELVAIGRGEFLDVLKAEVPPEAFIHTELIGQEGEHAKQSSSSFLTSDGMIVRAPLVIGADGCHSIVRELFCEPDEKPPRAALVNELVNRIDNLDRGLMKQFVGMAAGEEGCAVSTAGKYCFRKMYSTCPNRGKIGFGLVPVSETSLVWYCQYKADAGIRKHSARHKKQLAIELLNTLPSEFQIFSKLTNFRTKSHIYCPEFQGMPSYSDKTLSVDCTRSVAVLVGDSRGSFSPFTSQGTNAAIEDVVCFFRHLKNRQIRKKTDVVASLQAYDEERRNVWQHISENGYMQEALHLNPISGSRTMIPLCKSSSKEKVNGSEELVCKQNRSAQRRGYCFENNDVNKEVLRQRAYNFRWAESCPETIPLTAADPDFPAAPCIIDALKNYVADGYFSYGPSRGLPGFREAAAKVLRERKGISCATEEHILPTNSAAAAIFQVVKAILSLSKTPGTPEVIVMDPIDFLLVSSVESCGGIIRRWSISRNGALDYSTLDDLVNENTVLLSFCNPNNPLGRVFSPSELSQIGCFAQRHTLKILSDDIWSDIVYSDAPTPYTSIAAVEDGRFAQQTVTVFGFSKSFGLAGLRIGYICSLNLELLERIAKSSAVDFTADGATTLSQVAAQTAYEHAWPWFAKFLAHLEEARDFCAKKCLNTTGLSKCRAYPPQGTYVMLIDIRPIVDEGRLDDFTQWAAEKHKVRVVPGNERFFGPGSKGHVRICFSTSILILDTALDRLGNALCEWENKKIHPAFEHDHQ